MSTQSTRNRKKILSELKAYDINKNNLKPGKRETGRNGCQRKRKSCEVAKDEPELMEEHNNSLNSMDDETDIEIKDEPFFNLTKTT